MGWLRAAGVVGGDEVKALVRQADRLVAVSTKAALRPLATAFSCQPPCGLPPRWRRVYARWPKPALQLRVPTGRRATPGVWVAGNAHNPISHLVHAAASGAQAGPFITDYLIDQSLNTLDK